MVLEANQDPLAGMNNSREDHNNGYGVIAPGAHYAVTLAQAQAVTIAHILYCANKEQDSTKFTPKWTSIL